MQPSQRRLVASGWVENLGLLLDLAGEHHAGGNLERALELAERAGALAPDSSLAAGLRTLCLLSQGQVQRARDAHRAFMSTWTTHLSQISFSGGEPFADPKVLEVLKELKPWAASIRVYINTKLSKLRHGGIDMPGLAGGLRGKDDLRVDRRPARTAGPSPRNRSARGQSGGRRPDLRTA